MKKHRNATRMNASASEPSSVAESAKTDDESAESKQERLERRERESVEVDMRVESLMSGESLQSALAAAGDQLVVLEVESESVCELNDVEAVSPSYFEQPEDVLLEPCTKFKHSFQRIARNCPDVKFLSFVGDADDKTSTFTKDSLGVNTFPTLQFYKQGKLLWQHDGVDDALRDLDEGVLFYRDRDAQENYYVKEICGAADLKEAIQEADRMKEVLVVDVSSASATPCLHIFPAVVSLARAFQGSVTFARLIQDRNPETASLVANDLKVQEVPTFIFFFKGEERHRFTSSSRGDLIGQLLEQQTKIGYSLPPPIKKKKARSRVG